MFSTSDYTIKTVEQTIALDADHEEIKLLSKRTIEKHKEKYNYIHFGLVQIAAKPLTREGLDTSLLLCLRDSRFLEFNDSLLGMAETSLCGGPVYFDCFPNFTVSLKDKNILDTLTLNIKTANYRVKTGTLPVAIIYRIQYKVMNSAFRTGALKTLQKGETVLFQTDLARSRITVPRSITWNQISLPESWVLPEVAPADPIQNTSVSSIQQFASGAVQIKFNRSMSFRASSSSTTGIDMPRYSTGRRSVSDRPLNPSISTRLQDLDLSSKIPQARYAASKPIPSEAQDESSDDAEQEGLPRSPTYSSITENRPQLDELRVISLDKQNIRTEFYADNNYSKRMWFFDKYKGQHRQKIQEEFYGFLRRTKQHIQFFD